MALIDLIIFSLVLYFSFDVFRDNFNIGFGGGFRSFFGAQPKGLKTFSKVGTNFYGKSMPKDGKICYR